MLTGRRLQTTEEEPTVRETDSAALESLLSQGVLDRALDGPIPGVGRVLAFSHNILFDYATAIYVLYHPLDAAGLVKTLDADPTLPLVARPSFDLLVDMLWQARATGGFWPTRFRVAGSGHVLASLAVASRVINLVQDEGDLLELAERVEGSAAATEVASRRQFTHQLIGAVRARAVAPDTRRAMLPLAALAKSLAQNAGNSYEDAALATELLMVLDSRGPGVPEGPVPKEISHRAETIAMLLDAARSDPPRRERMAGILTRHAAPFIAVSSEVRAALHRLIDDETALDQWGGTVLTWFPEAVVPALTQDPDLARRLAVISVTFEEDRDEDVALGVSSVMPMRESRKQQSQHAAWRLARVFPEVCAADIFTATAIVCEAFGAAGETEDRRKWPMTGSNATGWLEHGYGYGMRKYGYDNERKMLSAVADVVSEQADEASDSVVDLLVGRVHDAGVWGALMEKPKRPAALCHKLFPAFMSGTLLAHPDTFSQAAILLKAAAMQGILPNQALEAAVAQALDLVDRNGRGDYVKDVLVWCLDREAIADESIAARRAAIGDDVPEIPAPLAIDAEWSEYSTVDHVLETGVLLEPELEVAARDLDRALVAVQNDTASDPHTIRQLADAFVVANDVFAKAPSTPSRLRFLVVDAAARLASVPDITPEHSCGPVVIQVLLDGSGSNDAGHIMSPRAWSPGIRDRAVEGLGTLTSRQTWREGQGDQVVDVVRGAISDENPLVRMSAARAFRSVFLDERSHARVGRLSSLLEGESDPSVRNAYMRNLSDRSARLAPVGGRRVAQALREVRATRRRGGGQRRGVGIASGDPDVPCVGACGAVCNRHGIRLGCQRTADRRGAEGHASCPWVPCTRFGSCGSRPRLHYGHEGR